MDDKCTFLVGRGDVDNGEARSYNEWEWGVH